MMSQFEIINISVKKQRAVPWGFNLKKIFNASHVSMGQVIEGTLSFRIGVREDDVILTVNDKDVSHFNVEEVEDLISKTEENLKLRVKRKKIIHNETAARNNQSSMQTSFDNVGPKVPNKLQQNQFILHEQRSQQNEKQQKGSMESDNKPSPKRPKLFDFDLNDAVSTLTIAGTNITLDEHKTKEFLKMSFEEDVRKRNVNKNIL